MRKSPLKLSLSLRMHKKSTSSWHQTLQTLLSVFICTSKRRTSSSRSSKIKSLVSSGPLPSPRCSELLDRLKTIRIADGREWSRIFKTTAAHTALKSSRFKFNKKRLFQMGIFTSLWRSNRDFDFFLGVCFSLWVPRH